MLFSLSAGYAQKKKEHKAGDFYFSWGYNKEWYTPSTIHIQQPELGNNFKLNKVSGHDNPGWTTGIFNKAPSIPQYNYRLGFFFNKQKGWGIEINFDHTKFIIRDQQYIHLTGTTHDTKRDDMVWFAEGKRNDSSSFYYLNNGANFLLFNIVKRWNWLATKNQHVKLDVLAKAGIGPVIPHVENKFFDQPGNEPHFQLGGWNTGLEAAVRATFFKHVYLEYASKVDYASYSGLRIYKGQASQNFGTYEMILSIGGTF